MTRFLLDLRGVEIEQGPSRSGSPIKKGTHHMKKLFAIIVSVIALLGLSTLTASATGAKLEQSAEITADCGEVTLTFTNNHDHDAKDFSYVWNIQTSDGQNYNVVVANSESPKTHVVTLAEGEGAGWVTYGVVAGPESDYYLANETVEIALCEPAPIEVTPEAPTLTQPTCEVPEPTLTVPEVEGVEYKQKGDAVPGHSVKVKAYALDGYVLTGDVKWHFDVAAVPGCDGDDGDDGEPGEDGEDGTPADNDDTTKPASSEESLPNTGGSTIGLLAGGGLMLLGGGLLAVRKLGMF